MFPPLSAAGFVLLKNEVMIMKKIVSFFILLFGMSGIASAECLMYRDFENIADNAVTYVAKNDDIATSSSNGGIKSYDFIYENGSTRLCFTGYKEAEIGAGNASRKFEFLFPEYNLEKYPGTKLVLGYDETVYERTENNYTHMLTADKNNNQISQLFMIPQGDTEQVRMFYKDTVYVQHGTNTEYKLIADMNTKKFIFNVGDKLNREYDFQTDVTELSKIIWFPNKGEKYSIDNIYAWAVPNTFSVKNHKVNMNENKISMYLSAPADKSVLNEITVDGENGIKITQDFKEARIDIVLNKLNYGKKYTVSFGENFKDIAGNTITGNTEITTEDFPLFNVSSEKNDGKYTVYAENPSENSVNAYIIAGLYNSDGKLEECAFFESEFASKQKHGFECRFKSDGTVKAFAAEKAGE